MTRNTIRTSHGWLSILLSPLLLGIGVCASPSIPVSYCSNVNTGTTEPTHSIYQSDGLCHDNCKAQGFQVAIVQADSCWCSNVIPKKDVQVALSQCGKPCPGFPDDICGGDGTYGYILIDQSSGPPPTSPPGDTSTPSPTPTPSVRTVTEGGSVMTVTVAAPEGTSSPNQANITSGGGGLNTGAAVGIAIGVVAILVGAAAVAFLLWRRKKQRDAEAGVAFQTPSPRGSSAGMNGAKMTEASTTPPFLVRHPTDGNWESDQSGRRRSTLMPIDPRIDPQHSGIYNRHENKSHDSINTLRDDQDYSRRVAQPKVLRATNPDPELD